METIPAVRAWLDAIALGVPVVVDDHPFCSRRVQFRFPRSRKSRIRKKWRKDERNYRQESRPDGMLLQVGGRRIVMINSAAQRVLKNRAVVRLQGVSSGTRLF